jgi:hypothetical protein
VTATKTDDFLIYPVAPIGEPDFEVYARDHVARSFPRCEFVDVVSQRQVGARYVQLTVRLRRVPA